MENLLPCSSTVSIPLYRNPLSELQSTGTAWSQLPQWSDCLPALTHTSIAWGTGLGLCNTQSCLASWIHCQCILWEDMAEEKNRDLSLLSPFASPQELTCLHPWWYKLKPIGSVKEQASPFPSDNKEQEQSPLKYAPQATVLTKSTLKVSNLAVTPNASFVPSKGGSVFQKLLPILTGKPLWPLLTSPLVNSSLY